MNRERKTKFLGRHLMVKGKYVKDLLNGRKKATIRKGIVKPKYHEIIIHGGGKPVAKARIKSITYKRLSELTDQDAVLDGFTSREELVRELEKVYGKLDPNEWVSIIELEILQRLDNLPAGKPYMGLSPGDIARIALKYLNEELSDEDKRILLDLTRTNSIRATAYRLFGDIYKRSRVRRVLRRVLDKLVEKGIIHLESGKK